MTDLSAYSDAELEAIAGGGGGATSSDLGSYSDSELEAIAGVTRKQDPLSLGAVWQDVKETPSALWGAVKSIPAGLSNLAHAPLDVANVGADVTSRIINDIFGTNIPANEANYARLERTGRGLGALGSGIAGAAAGSLLGPAGAITGGAAGVQGFNELLKATGVDPETLPEEDLANLRRNIVQGGVTYGALKGTGQAIKGVANKADDIAAALDRKSLGTRASDYGKASDVRTIDTPEGAITPVRAAIDDLLESNKLGLSRDPSKMLAKIDEASTQLSSKIGETISKFDETNKTPVRPDFDNAMEYLSSGKVPADLVPQYLNRLANLEESILREGQGKLGYLQQQKVAFGKSWDPADQVKSGFDRAVYSDLKQSIEAKVPQVKTLNQELSKYKTIEPIVIRSLKKAEAESPLSKLRDIAYTTGGVGAPTILGGTLGGPAGAILGAGAGLAGKALASPTGQALVARGLKATTKTTAKVGTALSEASRIGEVFGALKAQPKESMRTPIADLFSPLLPATADAAEMPRAARLAEDAARLTSEESMPKLPDAAKQALYNAVIKQESGGKADAVSNVGAVGLMQVMPATAREIAKELGVKDYDLKDPETNKRFGQYYLDKLLNMFDGDAGLALTAYHSGPGRVKQLLKKSGGRSLEDILSVPFKEGGLGPVGRKYAKQVLARIPQDTALA